MNDETNKPQEGKESQEQGQQDPKSKIDEPKKPSRLGWYLAIIFAAILAGAVALIFLLPVIKAHAPEAVVSALGYEAQNKSAEDWAVMNASIDQLQKQVRALKSEAAKPKDSLVTQKEFDQYKQQISELRGQVGNLATRPAGNELADNLLQSFEREIASIRSDMNTKISKLEEQLSRSGQDQRIDVALIRLAILSGHPFAQEAERLETSGIVLPTSLLQRAENGFPPMPMLLNQFRSLLPLAYHKPASDKEAVRNDGWLKDILNSASSLITIRSIDEAKGRDEAVNQMETALLTSAPNAYLAGLAKLSQEAQSVLEPVSSHVRAMSDALKSVQKIDAAQGGQ